MALAPSTLENWGRVYRNYVLPRFAKIRLTDLTTYTIHREWLNMQKEGVGINTIADAHKILSSALGDALRLGLINYSPASGAALPTGRTPEREIPTEVEAQLIVETAITMAADPEISWGHEMVAWLATMMALSLRPGEALGLQWGSIDLATREVIIERTVGKAAGTVKNVREGTKTARRRLTIPRLMPGHRPSVGSIATRDGSLFIPSLSLQPRHSGSAEQPEPQCSPALTSASQRRV